MVLEEENLKFEKSIEETVKLKNQKDNFSETPDFNNFLKQIKEDQKNIDINWFKMFLIKKSLMKCWIFTQFRNNLSLQ